MNKLQWNFNQNVYIFIQENAFKLVVWKLAAILSRSQCVYPGQKMGRLPHMVVRPHQAHTHQGRAKIDYSLLIVMMGSDKDATMHTVHHGTKQGRYIGFVCAHVAPDSHWYKGVFYT